MPTSLGALPEVVCYTVSVGLLYKNDEGQMRERGLSREYVAANDATALMDGVRWARNRARCLGMELGAIKVGHYRVAGIDETGHCPTGPGIFGMLEWKLDYPGDLDAYLASAMLKVAGEKPAVGLRWSTETLAEFAEKLAVRVNEETAADGSRLCDEVFSIDKTLPKEWPDGYRWVACYAVTGDSEGHYVHVDLVKGYRLTADAGPLVGDVIHVGMAKTFLGAKRAQEIAARCAEIAGA